jgi:hypothetical protein
MTSDAALERLNVAAGLPEILGAADTAFGAMMDAIYGYHDGGGAFYAALIMAAVPAADGRHAVISAPSLPALAADGKPRPEPYCRWSGSAVAAAVIGLADLTEIRLLQAVSMADDDRDAAACREAAASARQVREVLNGGT